MYEVSFSMYVRACAQMMLQALKYVRHAFQVCTLFFEYVRRILHHFCVTTPSMLPHTQSMYEVKFSMYVRARVQILLVALKYARHTFLVCTLFF